MGQGSRHAGLMGSDGANLLVDEHKEGQRLLAKQVANDLGEGDNGGWIRQQWESEIPSLLLLSAAHTSPRVCSWASWTMAPWLI